MQHSVNELCREHSARGKLCALLIAAFTLVVALALRWTLDGVLGNTYRLSMLSGAVAVAVYYGGWEIALLTAVAGYAAADFLFLEPRGALGIGKVDIAGLLTYAFSCGLIIWLGTAMRRAHHHTSMLAQQAQERESFITAALESINDCFYTVDRQWRFTYINGAAERYFGVPKHELLGKSRWASLPTAGKGTALHDELLRAMAEQVPIHVEGTATSTGRWIDLRAYPSPQGLAVLFTDAEERKSVERDRDRLEEELRQRAEDLVLAARRKNEFIALLAHELRNPLAPLTNGLQILRLQNSGAPSTALDVMERQVKHMVRLIEDLLDVSRLTHGKVTLHRETIRLQAVIDGAVPLIEPQMRNARHSFVIDVPDEPILLYADPVRLTQVIANLLSNACKFTDAGGFIALTARIEGGRLHISVRDTGCGIAKEKLKNIFDMFMQIRRTEDKVPPGLGLGLALVKGFVELHGGQVKAQSEGENRGSAFTVVLPVMQQLPAAETQPAKEQAERRLNAQRILVVDDNIDNAATTARVLSLMGHRVREAHDGPTALELARTFRPQFVLCDIQMPGMNGLELGRRLREQSCGKQVLVAMSGFGSAADHQESRKAGFDRHLVKPLDLLQIESLFVVQEADREFRMRVTDTTLHGCFRRSLPKAEDLCEHANAAGRQQVKD